MTRFLTDAAYLLLATVLGGLIGAQREATGRPAGLRTHILVCLGACLLTEIRFTTGDPARIAAQIVTGIGFLGAGVILRRGLSVRGLTTAATIWIVAGIGIAVGAGGLYAGLAAVTTVLSLATLTLGRRLENAIHKDEQQATLVITLPRHKGAVSQVLSVLTENGATVVAFEAEDLPTGMRTLFVTLRLRQDVRQPDLNEAIRAALPDCHIEWE